MRYLVLYLVCVTAALAAASVDPVDLRCDHRVNPLGLGERSPRLSWRLAAAAAQRRGLAQSAWQVLVASSRERLDRNDGDLWDSGRVASDATDQIAYGGRALSSRTNCWWKVRVWDQAGVPAGEIPTRVTTLHSHGRTCRS